jgi:WD40 repeat protein
MSVRFSPNSLYVAASCHDEFLRIWDVHSGEMVIKWKGRECMESMAFSPSRDLLMCGGWNLLKCLDINALQEPAWSGLSTGCRWFCDVVEI